VRSRLCLDLEVLSARVSDVHLGCPLSNGTFSFLLQCVIRCQFHESF